MERSFPAPAARRAGNRIQRFRCAEPHHAAHGLRAGRTVQGEAGVRTPARLPGGPAAAVRRSGALLVFDEIQTGMGRTGHVRHAQIRRYTDIVCAKAFGGGMPLGAFVAARNHGYAAIRRFWGISPLSADIRSAVRRGWRR
ncbi:MAG: aminotransferase class III-fold pyridoxal phosphate-dependent enzyme [Alistipes finegoldii]